MITKVKIVKAVLTDKNKDGSPCMAAGKPVKRIGIQTEQYDSQWLSCTIWRPGQKEENLKAGDEVELSIIERNGFRNFTIASKTDKIEDAMEALKTRVERLERLATPVVPSGLNVVRDSRIEPDEPDSSEIAF